MRLEEAMKQTILLILSLFALTSCTRSHVLSNNSFVYFGTYTRETSKGIYVSELDGMTGKLSNPELAVEIKNPSYVAIHQNKKFLFSIVESTDVEAVICSFAIAKDGKLTKINQRPTKGDHPCYVSIDKSGKTLFVANYSGGNIASYPIGNNGEIGLGYYYQHKGSSVTSRQKSPHPHSINVDNNNKFVLIADLGTDQIVSYKFDKNTGKLSPSSFVMMPLGGGPRHFSFHPNGQFVYANLELTRQAVAMAYNSETGTLKTIQVLSTLPEGAKAEGTTAECLVHPSGKWLYISNRGHNSIAIFSINQNTGMLTFVGVEPTKGKVPRGFGIDPSGKFLIAGHQKSENIIVFRINSKTGRLTNTGHRINVNETVNVRFLEK